VVHPAVGERPAPRDPPGRHQRAAQRAMRADRILGVARARRVEAALGAQPPRKRCAVSFYESDQHEPRGCAGDPQETPDARHRAVTFARASSSSTSVTSSCVRVSRIPARATSATSNPPPTFGATSRQAARRIRRARLRSTAPPTRRPATNATVPEPGTTNSITRSPWNARPADRMRRTRFRPVAPARPIAEPGPSTGGARRSHGPRASACGCGNRGASPGGGCSAERFASTSGPSRFERPTPKAGRAKV
jgi:hypothetical protein